ncbi:MAG: PKD domain-containing protein [Saprospiraceae bacterium]
MLNENTNCGDTATIIVNLYPEIEADFSFVYDTCVADVVTFTDLSQTGACCLTGWDWAFGDGQQSTQQNPIHLYNIPGSLPVTLTVRDTNQCEDQITRLLDYFPVPALIVIAPSEVLACEPASIFFDNLSFPIDSTYDIIWTFGDGASSTVISPTHIYDTPGTYTVQVAITSPIGCKKPIPRSTIL